MSNEDIVRRYVEATVAGDLEGEAALRHPEWSVHWPQSGERVMDEASYDQIIRNYPGGSPTSRVTRNRPRLTAKSVAATGHGKPVR